VGSGFGDDDDLDGGLDVGVQVDQHVVLADVAEGAFAQDDFALADRQAGGGEGIGDFAGPTEPNSLPSVEALAGWSRSRLPAGLAGFSAAWMAWALASYSARLASNSALLPRWPARPCPAARGSYGRSPASRRPGRPGCRGSDFLEEDQFHGFSCSLASEDPAQRVLSE
jgi:hypothetical protein